MNDLDLPAQDSPARIDLIDGQTFGLDGSGLADGHGTGGAVELADGDFGVGDGLAGRRGLSGGDGGGTGVVAGCCDETDGTGQ